jgi:hypothetical protein
MWETKPRANAQKSSRRNTSRGLHSYKLYDDDDNDDDSDKDDMITMTLIVI